MVLVIWFVSYCVRVLHFYIYWQFRQSYYTGSGGYFFPVSYSASEGYSGAFAEVVL